MNCPTCHNPMPDEALACPRCTQVRSYQAALATQRHFIARIRRGEYKLTFTKPAEVPGWHIGLANFDLAWCGVELNPHWKSRKYFWPPLLPLCDECRRVFEGLEDDPEVA